MKIVVIGGTGLIGSKLVNRLRLLGHVTVSVSPDSGFDTITGDGLNEVMQRAHTVVDVSNSPSYDDHVALDFFQRSTINILTAAAYAGVKHHIALSVVGAERLVDSGYLKAKLAQEELIRVAGVPFTILRSTQFFEFADTIAKESTNGDKVRVSTAFFQPISSDEVVEVLTEIVNAKPLNAMMEVAGPARIPMSEFIRYYLDSTEDSRQLLPDRSALYFGSRINDESLLPGENARIGKTNYQEWFSLNLPQNSHTLNLVFRGANPANTPRPFPREKNIAEGEEFLDDAIRMNDQPLIVPVISRDS